MNKHDVKRGQWWCNDQGWEIRVLGVVETYAVVRRPRAMPFLVPLRHFAKYQRLSIATHLTTSTERE